MAHRILENAQDLDDFATFLGNLRLPITVEWVQGRDRTKDQNALQWLWASEAGGQLGHTADEQQREWKLRFGVPILREDSADFRATYDRLIKPLSYSEKLEAMRFIDVTSIMKVRQMVRFLDAIWKECGELRVKLTDPDSSLAAYQKRNRERSIAA
jgi:hypothetical protein